MLNLKKNVENYNIGCKTVDYYKHSNEKSHRSKFQVHMFQNDFMNA